MFTMVLNHRIGAMTDVHTLAKIDARTLGNVSDLTSTFKLGPGIYGLAEDMPATAIIHVLPTGAMTGIIS